MASQQPTCQSQTEQICQGGPCEQNQNATLSQQASNFIQQTGEQVKNMAQGAAEAVKSTLGMNPENADNNAAAANIPSNTAATPAVAPSATIIAPSTTTTTGTKI